VVEDEVAAVAGDSVAGALPLSVVSVAVLVVAAAFAGVGEVVHAVAADAVEPLHKVEVPRQRLQDIQNLRCDKAQLVGGADVGTVA